MAELTGLDEEITSSVPLTPEGPVFEFICGPAGTGKTFQAQRRAEADPNCILCATTGIAAASGLTPFLVTLIATPSPSY